jgi:RNA polymerase sigma factor (sigma-70 family)
MGVAKNKWREELRKRSRISSINEQADFPDDEKKVMDIILTQEKVKLIQRALNALSPLCKKLLMLFYFEERSMDEIANILEFANTDVVKSKKYQCKKALEETLRKLEGDVNGL